MPYKKEMKKILCKVFGHKIINENFFYGGWCERCREWVYSSHVKELISVFQFGKSFGRELEKSKFPSQEELDKQLPKMILVGKIPKDLKK